MTKPKTSTLVSLALSSLYLIWVIWNVVDSFTCGSVRYCLKLSLMYDGFPWYILFGSLFNVLGFTESSLRSDLFFYGLCVVPNYLILLLTPRVLAKSKARQETISSEDMRGVVDDGEN